jgi:hypothetical protein
MVASGVGGIAMKGAKMAGGIASKVGKSGIGQLAGKAGKGIGSLAGKAGKAIAGTKVGGGLVTAGKGIGKGVGAAAHGIGWLGGKVSGGVGTAGAWLKGGQAAVDARNLGKLGDKKAGLATKKSQLQGDLDRYKKLQQRKKANSAGAGGAWSKEDKKFFQSFDEKGTMSQLADVDKEITSVDSRISAGKKVAAEDEEARIQRKGVRSRKALNAISTVYGLGQEFKSKLPGMKYHDQVIKAGASGSKALGDEFEAAHASIEYMKGKKVQDLVHDAPGVKKLVDAQNALAAREIMKEAGKEMSSAIETMSRNAESFLQNFARV